MKKYCIVLLLSTVCFVGIISFSLSTQQNDLGLRFEQEIGDGKVIKDLTYSFHMYGDQGSWKVDGKGKKLTASRIATQELNTQYDLYQGEIFHASLFVDDKNIAKKTQVCDAVDEGDDGCYDVEETTQVDFQITYSYKDKKGEMQSGILPESIHARTKDSKTFIKVKSHDEYQDKRLIVKNTESSDTMNDDYDRISKYFQTGSNTYQGVQYVFLSSVHLDYQFKQSGLLVDKTPGGLYKIDADGKVKQLYAMDMNKENIETMVIYKGQIISVVNNEKGYFLYTFDTSGKLLSKQELPMMKSLFDLKTDGTYLYMKYTRKSEPGETMFGISVLEKKQEWVEKKDFFYHNFYGYGDEFAYFYKDDILYSLEQLDALTIRAYGQDEQLYQVTIRMPEQNDSSYGIVNENMFLSMLEGIFVRQNYMMVAEAQFEK